MVSVESMLAFESRLSCHDSVKRDAVGKQALQTCQRMQFYFTFGFTLCPEMSLRLRLKTTRTVKKSCSSNESHIMVNK